MRMRIQQVTTALSSSVFCYGEDNISDLECVGVSAFRNSDVLCLCII
jgi:hypothetical protein